MKEFKRHIDGDVIAVGQTMEAIKPNCGTVIVGLDGIETTVEQLKKDMEEMGWTIQ